MRDDDFDHDLERRMRHYEASVPDPGAWTAGSRPPRRYLGWLAVGVGGAAVVGGGAAGRRGLPAAGPECRRRHADGVALGEFLANRGADGFIARAFPERRPDGDTHAGPNSRQRRSCLDPDGVLPDFRWPLDGRRCGPPRGHVRRGRRRVRRGIAASSPRPRNTRLASGPRSTRGRGSRSTSAQSFENVRFAQLIQRSDGSSLALGARGIPDATGINEFEDARVDLDRWPHLDRDRPLPRRFRRIDRAGSARDPCRRHSVGVDRASRALAVLGWGVLGARPLARGRLCRHRRRGRRFRGRRLDRRRGREPVRHRVRRRPGMDRRSAAGVQRVPRGRLTWT